MALMQLQLDEGKCPDGLPYPACSHIDVAFLSVAFRLLLLLLLLLLPTADG